MMHSFHLEFILHAQDVDEAAIKSSLAEFSEELEISDSPDAGSEGGNFKISVNTEEPTTIFDICSQFGRIRSIKIDEQGRKP